MEICDEFNTNFDRHIECFIEHFEQAIYEKDFDTKVSTVLLTLDFLQHNPNTSYKISAEVKNDFIDMFKELISEGKNNKDNIGKNELNFLENLILAEDPSFYYAGIACIESQSKKYNVTISNQFISKISAFVNDDKICDVENNQKIKIRSLDILKNQVGWNQDISTAVTELQKCAINNPNLELKNKCFELTASLIQKENKFTEASLEYLLNINKQISNSSQKKIKISELLSSLLDIARDNLFSIDKKDLSLETYETLCKYEKGLGDDIRKLLIQEKFSLDIISSEDKSLLLNNLEKIVTDNDQVKFTANFLFSLVSLLKSDNSDEEINLAIKGVIKALVVFKQDLPDDLVLRIFANQKIFVHKDFPKLLLELATTKMSQVNDIINKLVDENLLNQESIVLIIKAIKKMILVENNNIPVLLTKLKDLVFKFEDLSSAKELIELFMEFSQRDPKNFLTNYAPILCSVLNQDSLPGMRLLGLKLYNYLSLRLDLASKEFEGIFPDENQKLLQDFRKKVSIIPNRTDILTESDIQKMNGFLADDKILKDKLLNDIKILFSKAYWKKGKLLDLVESDRMLNSSAQKYFAKILAEAASYHIPEEAHDVQGHNLKFMINEIDPANWMSFYKKIIKDYRIYTFGMVKNEFELIEEIRKSNKDDLIILSLLNNNYFSNILYEINAVGNRQSEIVDFDNNLPINKWTASDILAWSDYVIAKAELPIFDRNNLEEINDEFCQVNYYDVLDKNSKLLPNVSLAEKFAVIKRAIYLDRGYEPRIAQIFATLILYHSDNGRFAEIATGEGKSLILAMLGALKIFEKETQHFFDIVTSSDVLAYEGHKDQQSFYNMLGITSSNSIDIQEEEKNSQGPRTFYNALVIYTTMVSLGGDLLNHESGLLKTRGCRKLDILAIDEVDNVAIDQINNVVMLSSSDTSPGFEQLKPLMLAIWHKLMMIYQTIYKGEDDKIYVIYPNEEESNEKLELYDVDKFVYNQLVEYIRWVVSGSASLNCGADEKKICVPLDLVEFIKDHHAKKWARSAMNAYIYNERIDYVISTSNGVSIIAPADRSNTGTIQTQMQWSDGLIQFLQIKHGLQFTSESLVSTFISNIGLIKKYGKKVFGITGTLGSLQEHKLVKELFGVDLAFVPQYKTKQLTEYPGLVLPRYKLLDQIIESAKAEAIDRERGVLIIAETIEAADQIIIALENSGFPKDKIKKYTRNDNDEILVSLNAMNCGEILVATNIAGRGTDLKITIELADKNGIHVMLVYLPQNDKIIKQVYGRAGRAGSVGTAQLIIANDEDYNQNIEYILEKNNEKHQQSLLYLEFCEIERVLFKDSLYNKILKLILDLREAAKLVEYEANVQNEINKYLFRNSNSNNRASLSNEQIQSIRDNVKKTCKSYECLRAETAGLQIWSNFGRWFSHNSNNINCLDLKRALTDQDKADFEYYHHNDMRSRIDPLFEEFINKSKQAYDDDNLIINHIFFLRFAEKLEQRGNSFAKTKIVSVLEKALLDDQVYSSGADLKKAKTIIYHTTDDEEEAANIVRAFVQALKPGIFKIQKAIEITEVERLQAGIISGESSLMTGSSIKLHLLQIHLEYIQKTERVLSNLQGAQGITVKKTIMLSDILEQENHVKRVALLNRHLINHNISSEGLSNTELVSLLGQTNVTLYNEASKMLDDFHNLQMAVLREFYAVSLDTVFEIAVYDIDDDWSGTIVSAVVGALQIAVGVVIGAMTGGLASILSATLIAAGIGDLIGSAMSIIGGRPIDINSYLDSKGGNLVINFVIEAITFGVNYVHTYMKQGSEAAKAIGKTAKFDGALLSSEKNIGIVKDAFITQGKYAIAGMVVDKVISEGFLDDWKARLQSKISSGIASMIEAKRGELKIIFASDHWQKSNNGKLMITNYAQERVKDYRNYFDGTGAKIVEGVAARQSSGSTVGFYVNAAYKVGKTIVNIDGAIKGVDKFTAVFGNQISNIANNNAVHSAEMFSRTLSKKFAKDEVIYITTSLYNYGGYYASSRELVLAKSSSVTEVDFKELEHKEEEIKESYAIVENNYAPDPEYNSEIDSLQNELIAISTARVIQMVSKGLEASSMILTEKTVEAGDAVMGMVMAHLDDKKAEITLAANDNNKQRCEGEVCVGGAVGNSNAGGEGARVDLAESKAVYEQQVDKLYQALEASNIDRASIESLVMDISSQAKAKGITTPLAMEEFIRNEYRPELRVASAGTIERMGGIFSAYKAIVGAKLVSEIAAGAISYGASNDLGVYGGPSKSSAKGKIVYDEPIGPEFIYEGSEKSQNTHQRIELQKKEILESLKDQFNKAEDSDQILAFKRLDQVYIVLKHVVGGGVLMSKEVFAQEFPNTYETLATYSDKLGQFIGEGINNIDTKLSNVLGDKYVTFKAYSKEYFAEVDKNAPQIVSDGLVLFTITGAGKVVFTGVEAGLAKAAKLIKKIDLPDSKSHGSTGALNIIAELPKTKIGADAGGGFKHFVELDANLLKKEINIVDAQLQSKFHKHAEVFGVKGNYNKNNHELFRQKIVEHVSHTDTLKIAGQYRGKDVLHYFNSKTEINVIKNVEGNFLSGWKLDDDQIINLKRHGNIQ